MTVAWHASILLTMVVACGFPAPADLPDAAPPADAVAGDSAEPPPPPGSTIQVSPAGDDANDGLDTPVKTLKRAIGIAAANTQITHIVLASGRYTLASGENFPYTVPANVTVTGPAGGGAILVGSKAEPGLVVAAGVLQDVEFEEFSVAISVTGSVRAVGVRIRSSRVAIRAETAAKLVVDKLDIAGAVAACATGIVLNGTAELTATRFASRNLATSVEAKDQSTLDLTNATLMGDAGCRPAPGGPTIATISGNTTSRATLRDSVLDGGAYGVSLDAVTIENTVVRNITASAIGAGSGGLRMTGGEVSNCGLGLEGGNASDLLTDVMFKGNGLAIYWYGPGNRKLVMRGCSLDSTVQIEVGAVVDFGTALSPGNNSFRSNTRVGLEVIGINGSGQPPVDAIGNTWRPVQGANQDGRYPLGTTIVGPVGLVGGTNYSIAGNRTLNL